MTPQHGGRSSSTRLVCTAAQVELHSARGLAENVREALELDSIPNMLYGLKYGKEALKMCVSALKSACWNFAKFGKVKKNTTMSPLSYTRRCAQDDCNYQPPI